MTSKPKMTAAPAGSAVTLADVKAQLSITWTDDDTLLNGYITAAETHLDGLSGVLGRFLLTQTWEAKFDGFCTGMMRLPFVDVQTVTVSYLDRNEVTQTVDSGSYALTEDEIGSYLVFYRGFSTPALADVPQPITISMVVGYGDASEVPTAIKIAIQMMVAQWFENREGLSEQMSEIPVGVSQLIEPYRVVEG